MIIDVSTPTSRLAVEGQLAQARLAYHNLMTGQGRVTVLFDGEQVTFTQTKKSDLANYISRLETALGLTKAPRPHARRVSFG